MIKETAMKKNVVMPTLKENMKEGVLCAWLKEEGEAYKKGDVLFEVETEKVVSQVKADSDGVIVKKFAEEGDSVDVNAIVAEVSEN